MNAMIPGAVIDRELQRLAAHLVSCEQIETAADAQVHQQPSKELRGVLGLRLSFYLGLFVLIHRINNDWQHKVLRGETLPNDEVAAGLCGVFERWLSLNAYFQQRANWLERTGSLDNDQRLLNLRLYTEEAHRIVREGVMPALLPSPSLYISKFPTESTAH